MSEDLVFFLDDQDQLGLIGQFCPRRGMDLSRRVHDDIGQTIAARQCGRNRACRGQISLTGFATSQSRWRRSALAKTAL